MKKLIALSAVGKDQPGIVAALSKVFFETGCNLEDSSMTQLKGEFAVLLLVSLPEKLTSETLKKAVEPVAAQWNLTFTLRELGPGELDSSQTAPGPPYTLVVYGIDHPGIVYRITQAAAEEKINISDLRTHVTKAKDTPLYSLIVELEIPDVARAGAFQKKLEILKKELKVEITLKPVETDEL
jgi:glycine cleavage system transcriptional repressor